MNLKSVDLPLQINTGVWDTIHIQGVAVDSAREFIYYSFTTILVKATLKGEIVGTVTGLRGHLGCIAYNENDGMVYGSLELKNDTIGKMVQKNLTIDEYPVESFHVAIFDVYKINRMNMDAFGDGLLSTVCLQTVAEDYSVGMDSTEGAEKVERAVKAVNVVKHRYGCSGIDGISFGPDFGSNDEHQYLCVAYGIYSDINREDNDHQVILQYNMPELANFISRSGINDTGIPKPEKKLFVYTGNTRWGIQNLEYDSYTNSWFAAVYKGKKPHFPNFSLFSIDGSVRPEFRPLKGLGDEKGEMLSLSKDGLYDVKTGIYGYYAKYGSTGLVSLGGGYYYISHHAGIGKNQSYSEIVLYRWTGNTPCPFEIVN